MTSNVAAWRRNVARVRADRFEDGAIFTATWVVPQPPPAGQRESDRLPHILIEQHHQVRRVGAVISAFRHSSQDAQVLRGAFSTSEMNTRRGYIALAQQLEPSINEYLCEVRHDDHVITDGETSRRPTGQAINVFEERSHDASSSSRSPLLLQVDTRRSKAVTQPLPSTGESEYLDMNTCAGQAVCSTTGGIVADETQPSDGAFIRQLLASSPHASGPDIARQQELWVATYYLSPQRAPVHGTSSCVHPPVLGEIRSFVSGRV